MFIIDIINKLGWAIEGKYDGDSLWACEGQDYGEVVRPKARLWGVLTPNNPNDAVPLREIRRWLTANKIVEGDVSFVPLSHDIAKLYTAPRQSVSKADAPPSSQSNIEANSAGVSSSAEPKIVPPPAPGPSTETFQVIAPDLEGLDATTKRNMAAAIVEHDPVLREYVHSHPMTAGVPNDNSLKARGVLWETGQLLRSRSWWGIEEVAFCSAIIVGIFWWAKQWNPGFAEQRVEEIQRTRREARFGRASTMLLLLSMGFPYLWIIDFPALANYWVARIKD